MEEEVQQLIDDIMSRPLRELTHIERQIRSIILSVVKSPTKLEHWNVHYKRINTLYNVMYKTGMKATNKAMEKALNVSNNQVKNVLRDSVKELKEAGEKGRAAKLEKTAAKVAPKASSIAPIKKAVQQNYYDAILSSKASVKQVLRRTSQTVVKDTALYKGLDGLTTQEIAKVFSDRLKSGAIDGKALNINGKIWGVRDYSNMLARTAVADAHSAGVVDSGVELVEVSSHGTTTEICKKYEGNIYSVNGDSSKYPKLEASPAFHPNCLHLLIPHVEIDAA